MAILKIRSRTGLKFGISSSEYVQFRDKETGLTKRVLDVIMRGPIIQLTRVMDINDPIRNRYPFAGQVDLDKENIFDEHTGEPPTVEKLLLQLPKCVPDDWRKNDHLVVEATESTVEGILAAIEKGFPIEKVTDPMGYIHPENKIYLPKTELKLRDDIKLSVEPGAQEDIDSLEAVKKVKSAKKSNV